MRMRGVGKVFSVTCGVLWWSILAAGCGPDIPVGSCPVVVVGPLTGQQAALGREISRARLILESELTESSGAPIKFLMADSSSSPSVARVEVERLLEQTEAPVVVGSIISAETKEFLPGTLARGSVVIANGSSDPTIRELPFRKSGDRFFRNWPADDFEGRVMAEYLQNTNRAERLVVLNAADPYAAALSDAFVQRFEELGGQVVERHVYPLDLTTFQSLIRRAPLIGHDGYYLVGFPSDLAGIYDTIRSINELQAIPVYSAVGINTAEFTQLARAPLDNLFFTSPSVDEASGPYFEFRRQYMSRFSDETPDIVSAVTYDALRIAATAIRAAGCDSAKIAEYLYQAPPFSGASGPTGFDSLGDVITKAVAINYYDGGRKQLAETRLATN